MSREKECFRENLMRIREFFPDKELLNKKDVCTFTGENYRTVCKCYKFNKQNKMTPQDLARQISV